MTQNSSVAELIVAAEHAGLRLQVRDGHVRYRGPRSALRPELFDRLRRQKDAVRAVLSERAPSAPCASDVIERAAIIAEACGRDRDVADERALRSYGYATFSELAFAQATEITGALGRLPHPVTGEGLRLLDLTRLFLRSGHFLPALELGWSREDLFGVAPGATFDTTDGLGLIPAIAFPLWPHPLQTVVADHAIVQARSGSSYRIERFRSDMANAKPWWENDDIVLWC